MGSKLFPFTVDSFSEGVDVLESKQCVTKVASLLKMALSLPSACGLLEALMNLFTLFFQDI